MEMEVITQYGKRIDSYKNAFKLRIQRAIYKNGVLQVQIDGRNLTGKEKREYGLFNGKRKQKHYIKR